MASPSTQIIPAWRWALVQMRRDLRATSMRVLLLAVMLAVAALTSVAFFADRIERGLSRDAAKLLGGDVVVRGDQALPTWFEQQASQAGLRTARTASFPSMARAPDEAGGDARLVSLKAVSETYPLRGEITLGKLDEQGQVQRTGVAPVGGPASGEAWVDSGLLMALGLKLGDSIWLGEKSFHLAAIIVSEPDRGSGFSSFSPRVMIREQDLVATELVQPASRVNYRLLVAGPARQGDAAMAGVPPTPLTRLSESAAQSALSQFVDKGEAQAKSLRGVQIETLDQGRPEMRTTLDRAGLFLRLVALLAALLSAVAVAVVSRDFAQRRLDDCALMRVLGVPQSVMAWSYGIQFLGVGLLASLLGLMLGWGCHHIFVTLLSDLVKVDLPMAGWQPVALGMGTGVLLTLGFGLPPVLQLARVPPLRVLRRDLGKVRAWSLLTGVLGIGALLGLLMAVAQDIKLGAIALGGFALAIMVFAVCGALAVWVLRYLAQAFAGRLPPWLTLATRQMTAQPGHTVVQVCALGVGLLALLLLVLIRTDLVDSWRAATPPDAPNRFVINIQPDQAAAFQDTLKQAGVTQFDWYPMVRARLLSINGRAVRGDDFTEGRAQRLVEREFNLSYAAKPPAHNAVVAGRYQADEPQAFSVEAGLAKTLGLKLGDRLTFDMAGTSHEGRVTSLRQVDWASMRVNFFVMAPSDQMPDWPSTYITAFKMPPGSTLDRTLMQQFPNLTVVDVSATLTQIQSVLGQVITAVEFLFVFTLAAGLVVLMAGLMTSRERRAREWAILRSLGAKQALLARIQRMELLGLGALAGALAAAAALAIGGVLATHVFDFAWQAPWWWLVMGAVVGASLSWSAGWWSLRGVMQRPVTMTLRQAE